METGKVFRDGQLVDPVAKKAPPTPEEIAHANDEAMRLFKSLVRRIR